MNDTNNYIESEEEISIENATGEEGAWSPRGTAFVAPDAFIIETEKEEGHVNTRDQNFECENKDPHLGCDMGIDVAG